jgi:hypothetical protein
MSIFVCHHSTSVPYSSLSSKLLLPEGKSGRSLDTFNEKCSFGILGLSDGKVLSLTL